MNILRLINKPLRFILYFVPVVLSIVYAQTTTVNLDRDKILIGEQVCVQLKLQKVDAHTMVLQQWFSLPDTANHLEIIKRGAVDSVIENGLISYTQNLYLTSFDSGKWQLQYKPAIVWDKTSKKQIKINYNTIFINVLSANVAAMKEFHGLKGIAEVETPDNDWKVFLLVALPLLAIALGGWYLLAGKKKSTQPVSSHYTKDVLHRALHALEILKQEQPKTTDQIQQYYLQIDHICRNYIGEVSDIDALHKTTDELIIVLQDFFAEESARTDFHTLLRACEAVKFAREQPTAAQHLEAVEGAKNCLNQAKVVSSQLSIVSLSCLLFTPCSPLLSFFDFQFSIFNFQFYWVLGFLLLIPLLIVEYIRRRQRLSASMMVTTIHFVSRAGSWRTMLVHMLFVLRCAALILLIIALARPQQKFAKQQTDGEGIDIVLCFDVSGSMTEKDILPSRIEAGKTVAADFVKERPGDRMGVVVFSDQSFSLCPLTTDHRTVLLQINNIECGYLQDAAGTAIGSGIATSVNRLKESKSATKAILLLTDGADFGETVAYNTAIQMAKLYKIKIYTIGLGASQETSSKQQLRSAFNENLLKDLSQQTGGQYFHAADREALQKVYAAIGQLEKSTVSLTSYNRYTDKYFPFLFAALILLVIEIVLRYTVFKRFP